jgi:DNA-binding Lrp family transcriptional regulator
MKLDALDLSILKLLQKNSKLTNKALSTHLSLSVTAVYERIKKLEKTGIIKGYVALLSKKSSINHSSHFAMLNSFNILKIMLSNLKKK